MIGLPEGLVFAEVVGNLGLYCVFDSGDKGPDARIALVLCGAPLHAVVPEGWGPDGWGEVHRDCQRVLLALGRCPVCGRLVEVARGRVQGHGGCVGVNMRAQR